MIAPSEGAPGRERRGAADLVLEVVRCEILGLRDFRGAVPTGPGKGSSRLPVVRVTGTDPDGEATSALDVVHAVPDRVD